MTNEKKESIAIGVAWTALGVALLRLATGCTPAQLEAVKPHVVQAEDLRDIVCAVAEAGESEEFDRIRELCKQESNLRELAAEYAGCENPASPSE